MTNPVDRFRTVLHPLSKTLRNLPHYRHTEYGLILSCTALGIGVGFAVYIFHAGVSLSESFFNRFFVAAESNPLSVLRFLFFPLITAFGGLLVGILNQTVFKKIEQENLAAVHRAVKEEEGIIRGRASLKAILAAALSIGSGGGAGREAPTVVLGASLGSTLGRVLRLKTDQLRVLCGAGTAAAISGIFNAPLAGVVFAVETVIGHLSVQSFIPLVISSVMATATSRLFLGDRPILITPGLVTITLQDYAFLALAGLASGGVALYFLKAYSWSERRVRLNLAGVTPYLRPAVGGLGAGLLVAILPTMLETTYEPVNLAILGHGTLLVAVLTVLLKPMSAALTIGSGGAGGTFAPAMKVGAMFGFAFGYVLQYFIPGTSPGVYALVCCAAVLAGTYRMPLAGGLLVFEISRNYGLILPLMFVSVFATFLVHRTGVRTFNPSVSK
ncbi:MAG: chloride channel protein [Ignavibacteriales bacterium]|nr:chloride channel protein [Ignavibacteriales bacterium]